VIRLLRAGLALAALVALGSCRVEVVVDGPPDAGYTQDGGISEVDASGLGDAAEIPVDAGTSVEPDAS